MNEKTKLQERIDLLEKTGALRGEQEDVLTFTMPADPTFTRSPLKMDEDSQKKLGQLLAQDAQEKNELDHLKQAFLEAEVREDLPKRPLHINKGSINPKSLKAYLPCAEGLHQQFELDLVQHFGLSLLHRALREDCILEATAHCPKCKEHSIKSREPISPVAFVLAIGTSSLVRSKFHV